jgi:hypothetical protein
MEAVGWWAGAADPGARRAGEAAAVDALTLGGHETLPQDRTVAPAPTSNPDASVARPACGHSYAAETLEPAW